MKRHYVIIFIASLFVVAACRTFAGDASLHFRASVPDGWFERPSDKAKTKWWLTTLKTRNDYPIGMIMVDSGRPVKGTLSETVAGWIATYGGKITDAEAKLDGVHAVRISVLGRRTEYGPREALIAENEGLIYIVTGGGEPEFDVGPAFELVARSWQWIQK